MNGQWYSCGWEIRIRTTEKMDAQKEAASTNSTTAGRQLEAWMRDHADSIRPIHPWPRYILVVANTQDSTQMYSLNRQLYRPWFTALSLSPPFDLGPQREKVTLYCSRARNKTITCKSAKEMLVVWDLALIGWTLQSSKDLGGK